MTNFIYDNTGLPIDKINLGPLPPGANPRQWIVNTEWIVAMQALLDVQTFARGAVFLGLTPNVADPVPSGVAKYIWLKSDGTVWKTIDGVPTEIGSGGGAGPFALPEQWSFQNVPASQTATVLSAAVSTEFDAIRMIRAGSIVGLGARLTEAVSAGTLTVSVTKNGVIQPSLNVVMVSGTAGQATAASGAIPYVAGDLIGVVLTTDGSFAPTTTDLESWVEVTESVSSGPSTLAQGTTPGAGAGETVDLLDTSGNATIVLEDAKTYAFKITAACGGTIAAVRGSRTIVLEFNARRDAGLTVITAAGPGASYGDAANASWTLTALVGAGPDRIIVRFSTGATTAATSVAARMEFTETVF
jgi:hypothetical protein